MKAVTQLITGTVTRKEKKGTRCEKKSGQEKSPDDFQVYIVGSEDGGKFKSRTDWTAPRASLFGLLRQPSHLSTAAINTINTNIQQYVT